MRMRIDRATEALRLELGEAEARRVEVAEGVTVAYDAAGRIVGIELRGVDPAALHEFTVELAGLADRPAGIAPSRSAPSAPAPTALYTGPLSWDPEAEAAMLNIPFFSRGRHRLAAGRLARERGSDRVTVEIVGSVGR